MFMNDAYFEVRLARSKGERDAAQALRYRVFAEEWQAKIEPHSDGDVVNAYADHLLLLDRRRAAADQLVATTRLLRADQAASVGGFVAAQNYVLPARLQQATEMSRTCVASDYRGGTAILRLWQGVAAYLEEHGVDCVLGLASLPGTDWAPWSKTLERLHSGYLAPLELRAQSVGPGAVSPATFRAACAPGPERSLPALIKAYLRLGAVVGEGAHIDHDFNCIDVAMVLSMEAVRAPGLALYGRA